MIGIRVSRLYGCECGETWDAEGRIVEGYDEPIEFEPDVGQEDCPVCGREGERV